MLLFFDFMVWPRTPWPNLSIRNYICCVDPYTPLFCVHFNLATERIVKNWGCWVEGFGHGVKINYVSKNSFSNLLIRVGTAPLKYDAGMMSMYGSSPGITNCTLYLCFFG